MSEGKERPNFVLIVADDMGFSDIGCFGSEISTLNLDRLGYEGIRLTQVYNHARCCPSRASLMTGRYPHESGVGYMSTDLGYPGYEGFLSPDVPTIAELLAQQGYQTRIVGKWHLGGDYTTDPETWEAGTRTSPRPIDRGFTEHYGTLAGAGSYYEPHTLIHNDKFIEVTDDDFYYTEEIGRQAVRMVGEMAKSDSPFFLYIAHVAPHWPLQARAEDINRYTEIYRVGWDEIRQGRLDRAVAMGLLADYWRLSDRDPHAPPWDSVENKAWESHRMAVYAAQVEALDHTVGDLVGALETAGARDNTVIVFISDNGGCAELLTEDGPIDELHTRTTTVDGRPVRIGNRPEILAGPDDTYQSYGLPWANASNSPFRLFKHWVHEGGISTPAIINWPHAAIAGNISHEPMHIIDLIATFEALGSGKSTAGSRSTAGDSILPLLAGQDWKRHEPIFWEHEGNRAVRIREWKLVAQSGGPWELYNMVDDRTETTDLSGAYPALVAEMAGMYEEWAKAKGVVDWSRIEAKFPGISHWMRFR